MHVPVALSTFKHLLLSIFACLFDVSYLSNYIVISYDDFNINFPNEY